MKNKPECKVDANGTKSWWLNGEPHREDGPAYIGADGAKEWYLNGKLYYHNGQTEYEQVQGLVKWLEAVERITTNNSEQSSSENKNETS